MQTQTKGAEMDTKTIVDAAEAERDSSIGWSRELAEAAVAEGLVDGDRIDLGGPSDRKLIGAVEGADFVLYLKGVEAKRIPVVSLDGEMVFAALKCKARRNNMTPPRERHHDNDTDQGSRDADSSFYLRMDRAL
jgi:hypothetical protein